MRAAGIARRGWRGLVRGANPRDCSCNTRQRSGADVSPPRCSLAVRASNGGRQPEIHRVEHPAPRRVAVIVVPHEQGPALTGPALRRRMFAPALAVAALLLAACTVTTPAEITAVKPQRRGSTALYAQCTTRAHHTRLSGLQSK